MNNLVKYALLFLSIFTFMILETMFVKGDIYVFSWTHRTRQFIAGTSIITTFMLVVIFEIYKETVRPPKR